MSVFDSSGMNLAVQLKLLPDRSFLLPNHCRQSLAWGVWAKLLVSESNPDWMYTLHFVYF